MSDNKPIYQRTIVRLYHNPNYGKAIGEKRRNQFVFNGSVEFLDLRDKLFLDLTNIDHAKAACQPSLYADYMDVVHHMAKTNKADIYEQDRFFFSQFKYVRPVREFINGFILFDAIAMQGTVCLFDGDGAASVLEEFSIIACFGEKKGKSPDYFGCNFDLETDVPKVSFG